MIVSYAQSIAELAKEGARIAKERGILDQCGKMCDTCAFKWEQEHVLPYFMAADVAADMLMNGGEFNCHTHNFRCADKPCAGFQFAKLVYAPDTPDTAGSAEITAIDNGCESSER